MSWNQCKAVFGRVCDTKMVTQLKPFCLQHKNLKPSCEKKLFAESMKKISSTMYVKLQEGLHMASCFVILTSLEVESEITKFMQKSKRRPSRSMRLGAVRVLRILRGEWMNGGECWDGPMPNIIVKPDFSGMYHIRANRVPVLYLI